MNDFEGPQLPEHPELRQVAQVLESANMAGQILDASFRTAYLSTEFLKTMGITPAEANRFVGKSLIHRVLREDKQIIRVSHESGSAWFDQNAPIMRHYLDPSDPLFAEVFSATAEAAAALTPPESLPRAWIDVMELPSNLRFRRNMLGDQIQVQLRLSDDAGAFIGVLCFYRPTLRESVMWRLGRGDPHYFERMDRMSEPARRSAAILFADLEASGALSKRLSSRGYFDLVRELTDLIDSEVIARRGIVGKHAGDGGSALFLASEFDNSESAAARASIEAARAIREGAAGLGPDDVEVTINIGAHWGATLMIGQVATLGRLEVTALGDQMNEAARIEAVATSGQILASKDVIERLDAADSKATGIAADSVAYRLLSEIDGASGKAIRDAGAIAVTAI